MMQYMVRFSVTSSPHPRSLAQYFVQSLDNKMDVSDLRKYYSVTKDAKKLLEKIKFEVTTFHSNLISMSEHPISILTLKSSGVQFGFTNAYNEYIDSSFVETVRSKQYSLEHLESFWATDHPRVRDGIILCATLIDKTPNLAGLTKTCEIFNASALLFQTAETVGLLEY